MQYTSPTDMFEQQQRNQRMGDAQQAAGRQVQGQWGDPNAQRAAANTLAALTNGMPRYANVKADNSPSGGQGSQNPMQGFQPQQPGPAGDPQAMQRMLSDQANTLPDAQGMQWQLSNQVNARNPLLAALGG